MTDNNPAGATPPEEEPDLSRQQEPDLPRQQEPDLPRQQEPDLSRQEADASRPADDPGYLAETGEAVGEDGSVVPIIGGLPAVEGSAWDIGAPRDERGPGLAEELGSPEDQASQDDTRSS